MSILNYRFKLRRRRSGASGAPTDHLAAEMAVNETENAFYYGKGEGVDGQATSSPKLFHADGSRLWHSIIGAADGSTQFVGNGSALTGLPSGVTSGSNANGSWIRAAGMQICWHELSAGSILAFGAGTLANPYRTATTTWTFPIAFDVAPSVVTGSARPTGGTPGVRGALHVGGGIARQPTFSSNIQAYRTSDDNTADDITLMLVAFGTY